MKLAGKVAIITGASSGIGKTTAILFAEHGCKVVVVGRNMENLNATYDTIREHGGQCVLAQADVRDTDACREALDLTLKQFGRLDILVNGAGIIGSGSIETTTREEWQRMMRVNLDSVFELTQMALPHLAKTKGNIVNISSVAGVRAFPNLMAYCVGKAALDQFTKCAALDLAPRRIRVNAVNPGVVVTDLHRRGGMDEQSYAKFLEHSETTHPLGRVGRAEEVAEAILYLASGEAGWVTGVTLSIDGGRHLTCAR